MLRLVANKRLPNTPDLGSTNRRIGGIDVMLHVLCIGVIVIHSWSASRYSEDMYPFYSIVRRLADGSVLGFFFIAGFLSKPSESVIQNISKNARRLLLPFFLFSLAYGISRIFLAQLTPSEMLLGLVSLEGNSMQLYFLPYLFLTQIGAGVLCPRHLRTTNWYLPFLISALFGCTLLFPTQGSTGPGGAQALLYSTMFVAGIVVLEARKELSVLMLLLFLTIGFVLDARFLSAAGVIGLFYTCRMVPCSTPLAGSGGVYLLHTPIINFGISIALYQLGIFEEANFILTVFFTYLLCLLFTSFVIYFAPGFKKCLLE